jgi:hypothetical protein
MFAIFAPAGRAAGCAHPYTTEKKAFTIYERSFLNLCTYPDVCHFSKKYVTQKKKKRNRFMERQVYCIPVLHHKTLFLQKRDLPVEGSSACLLCNFLSEKGRSPPAQV